MPSIELDCPPGNPRPNDLINHVLEGTGLTVDDFTTDPPFFGLQTWHCNTDNETLIKFQAAKDTFKARVSALYDSGAIRYGSW